MDTMARSVAWAAGALAFGAADLYAVGARLDAADLLLLGLGAAPVLAFAFVLLSRDGMDNRRSPTVRLAAARPRASAWGA